VISAEACGAFGELEARLRPYVARRVASAADTDDVVQEIFVRLHRGIGELGDFERFGPWVYRIAEHAVADHFRARRRHPFAEAGVLEVAPAASNEPDDDALLGELGECVALFVSRLRSPYREAVTLTELEGMTQKDAAEMLGISVSGMKSRVQRARARIREMFESCCEVTLDARGRVTSCVARSPDDVPSDCRDAAISWATRHPD
jgi:RNA polymerase sigma-70 factor (ECF subfamily)